MYTELKSKVVKCRKAHYCRWCAEEIVKGSQARYRAYMYDGFKHDWMHLECCEFKHDWMHLECYEAMGDIDWYDSDMCTPGDFKRGSSKQC